MGNNEVVGPYGAGTVFGPQVPALAMIRGALAMKTLKTGQWLDHVWRSFQRGSDAEWGGMRMFVKNQLRAGDSRMPAVYSHFRRNLEDIISAGTRCGAEVVVCTVASNLKDCAPFASLHQAGMTQAAESEWNILYSEGMQAEKAGKPAIAAAYYSQAAKIDGQYADLQFRWGRCCLAMERGEEARLHLSLARDFDALRFRADSWINDIIRHTARGREKEKVRFVDVEDFLGRRSPGGLPGAEWFYEHVHFNFEGNYCLAREIAGQIAGILPSEISSRVQGGGEWPSMDDCARALAWTDYCRYEAASSVLLRLNDPPFTTQLDHEEQCQRLRRRMESLLPATQPAGLRQALNACRQAVLRAPGDWAFHIQYGGLQQKLGDLSGALDSWKKVSLLLPHHDDVLCQLGALLNMQNRPDEAGELFRTVLRRRPDSRQALNGLGYTLSQQGRHSEAMTLYQRVLKISPDYFETHLNMGNALSALGRIEEARAHYRAALKHPMNTPGSLVVLANICLLQGWQAEAVETYEHALRLAPDNALAHLALGNVLASSGHHAGAHGHFAESVRLNPDCAEAQFKLGLSMGRQGLDDQAMARFAEAVRLKPDLMEARLNLGVALLKQRRGDEAAPHFQEVLRSDPNNALARKYLDAIAARHAKP
jgi:tetratricopeptide (TPR) repeat protein